MGKKDHLTKDQQSAYNAIVLRREPNVFVTGGGGVGKSYLIKKIVDDMTSSGLVVLVGASTNQAASEIGGSTVHRIFHIPIEATWEKAEKEIHLQEDDPLLKADVIIIDEISMIRIDVFDYMSHVVQHIRNEYPERNMQLVLVGDFAQLPPVIKEKEELGLLKEHYGDSFHNGYAFECPLWHEMDFKMYELLEVVRQKDSDMVEALQKIRFGDTSGLEYFKKNSSKKMFSSNTAITLCGSNKEAQDINNTAISKIPGREYIFDAIIEGDAKSSDRFSGAADRLTLKNGCRVIMLLNGPEYSKGDAGTVTEIHPGRCTVRLDNGSTIYVTPYTSEVQKYFTIGAGKDKQVYLKTVGKYTQLPITPSYGITIHRSQGQTYEKANVLVGKTEIFAAGQLYVALSRVRTAKGLYIRGDLDQVSVLASDTVREFYGRKSRKNEADSIVAVKNNVHRESAPKSKKSSPVKQETVQKKQSDDSMVAISCSPSNLAIILIYARSLSKSAKKSAPDKILVPQEWADSVQQFADRF